MKKESAETFRNLLTQVYGPKPPLECRARLEAEIMLFPQSVVDELYLTYELRKAARKQGLDIDFASDYGASLIYFITGCSNINPLPAHYFCPVCKKTVFVGGVGDGWDLPEKTCCGRIMVRDGHAIPLEIMKAHKGRKSTGTAYSIPESFLPCARQVVENYYRDEWLVVPYTTELERDGEVTLDNGFRIVAHDPPGEPGLHLVLLPPEHRMPELDDDGIWQAAYRDVHGKDFRTIVFKCSKNKEILGEMAAEIGAQPTINDLLTGSVMRKLTNVLDDYILAGGRTLPMEEEPTFSSLMRQKAFINAEDEEESPPMRDGGNRLLFREDVWKMLDRAIPVNLGTRHLLIDQITDRVSKGWYAANGMNPETEQLLRDFGITEANISQMKCTRYLRPKAKEINDLLDDLYFFWYRLQFDDSGDYNGDEPSDGEENC